MISSVVIKWAESRLLFSLPRALRYNVLLPNEIHNALGFAFGVG